MSVPTGCGLFDKLSPDLRNEIYRLALPSEETYYNAHPFFPPPKMPAILHTNRAIKSEAESIYYGENHFKFSVSSGHSMYIAWCRVTPARVKADVSWLGLDEIKPWGRYLNWFAAFYRHECDGPWIDDVGETKAHAYTLSRLFRIVRKLEKGGMGWVEVRKTLELFFAAMRAAMPPNWLDEEVFGMLESE